MKTIKILSISLGVVLLLTVLAMFSFRNFTRTIRNQRTCEWANIDNIELHAGVDIPEITSSDCNYNEATNTKKAFFVFDQDKLDVERYLEFNKLQRVQDSDKIQLDKFLNLNKDSLAGVELYSFNQENSYALFDKTNSRIWVTIEYKD